MKLDSLRHLGLTAGEITVFEALLTNGPQPVSDLIIRTKLKKGDCYNKLANLMERGLIEEFTAHKKKHYRLANPKKLEELANLQYQEASIAKRELESLMPDLTSTYTLAYQQPGIITFEGPQAMRRVLDDSLTAKGVIMQYVDLDAVLGVYPQLNAAYARKRTHLGVKKQIVVSDTPLARRYASDQDPAITEVRLVDYQLPKFASVMQIYDDNVSYLTLKPEGMIGVIITDPFIAKMHQALFQMNWTAAHKPPTPETSPPHSAVRGGSS